MSEASASIHQRRLSLGNDGKEVRGEDRLIAQGPAQDPRSRALRHPLPPRARGRGDRHRRRHGRDPPLARRAAVEFPLPRRDAARSRTACSSTATASPCRRCSWSSSAKSRPSAAKSPGSSAAPANLEDLSMTDLVPIRRALISLSDKSGLDELGRRAGARQASSWSRPAAPRPSFAKLASKSATLATLPAFPR